MNLYTWEKSGSSRGGGGSGYWKGCAGGTLG